MKKETSRERVLKTFAHQEPESMAIDFGSSTSTGISIFAYDKLKKYLQMDLDEPSYLYELFLMMADPSMPILDRMGGDVVQLKRYAPNFDIPLKDWKDWTFHDGTRCKVPGGFQPVETDRGLEIRDQAGNAIARMPKNGFYFDQTYFPCAEVEEVEEVDALDLKGISDEELDWLARESERLHRETDKAVMFPIYARTFEAGMRAWGFEEWLVQLMSNRPMVHRYLERLTEIYIQDLDRVLSRCNESIDFIRFCDDLGTQTSLMMSIPVYREMIKPYHTRMFQFIKKKYPKQKIALHCCGSIQPLIPDLIESGVDILNPVQISASNMDPAELKREFGKDIVFWGGGADMQFKIAGNSCQEIEDHVKGLIDIFAPGGGFLFAPTHNIQADVPPEKVMAIYDTALRAR